MSDLNAVHNRAVWFDIPVSNLDRAAALRAPGVRTHRRTTAPMAAGLTGLVM